MRGFPERVVGLIKQQEDDQENYRDDEFGLEFATRCLDENGIIKIRNQIMDSRGRVDEYSVSRGERIDGFVFLEQSARFLKPACVGDTVTPRFTVERRWSEGKRNFCRVKTMLLNQHGETLLEGFHLYGVFGK